MRASVPAILLFASTIALSGAAFGAQAVDTPVTSTVADVDATGVALRIQSDGAGPYTNSKMVQSVIQALSHDWVLDTNWSRQSTRAVYVDFGDPIAGSAPGGVDPVAPFSTALVKGRFISKCHETNVNMFTIAAGSTVICPMALSFNYGGTDYRLAMNPANYSDTNWINVTCQSASNGSCDGWLLEPNGVYGTPKNSTKLLKIAKNGALSDQGDFYMSFSIAVTNP